MISEYIYNMLPTEWPLVIGDLPATANNAVGIIEYDGATSTEYFGAKETSSILSPIVKCVVRHSSYKIGQEWITYIKDTLHRYHDPVLLSVLLVGAPMYLGRTPEKLHEFQITFRTQVKE